MQAQKELDPQVLRLGRVSAHHGALQVDGIQHGILGRLELEEHETTVDQQEACRVAAQYRHHELATQRTETVRRCDVVAPHVAIVIIDPDGPDCTCRIRTV